MQQQVFEYFKQISQIPRESGNETGIANYIMKLAESENWESYRDESNNVLIKKAASIGYENAPVVMLQGHMDMVCEKKPGVLHDFSKDPIKLRTIDDYIYADGTTLGADNGIGLAMCLSVLKDNKLKHPPLEVLFTVSEEKGMKGVQALDGSKFNSSILINLDSEGEGVFTAGCAGGQRIALSLPLKRKKIEDRKCYRIAVCGLKGGHSGDDIDKQRGNAIKILGRILADIRDDISLCSLKGGTKENVIPSEAEALVAVSNDSILREKIILWNEILRNEYQYSDPEIKVILDNCSDIEECLEDDIASKIVTAINLLPNGVNTKNNEIDLVVSSDNIGVVEEYPDKIEIKISIRITFALP